MESAQIGIQERTEFKQPILAPESEVLTKISISGDHFVFLATSSVILAFYITLMSKRSYGKFLLLFYCLICALYTTLSCIYFNLYSIFYSSDDLYALFNYNLSTVYFNLILIIIWICFILIHVFSSGKLIYELITISFFLFYFLIFNYLFPYILFKISYGYVLKALLFFNSFVSFLPCIFIFYDDSE